MRHLFVWFALLAGFGLALNSVPSRAADKADAETIEKLVKQLASGRYAQREQAQKKLENRPARSRRPQEGGRDG